MAAGLYRSEPVFRDEVQRCCRLLQPILGLDLREVLFSTAALQGEQPPVFDLKAMLNRGPQGSARADRFQQTWISQPAVFVIEYCLARLLMSWGIRPQAVIGYSLGEFVAATVAGSLKLEDALRLVALRARLIDSLPAGAMLAVPLSEAELAPHLSEQLSIAIRNTPRMTVVSGVPEAIEALEARLSQRGILTRRLQTTHAFHSAMMQGAREGLSDLLRTVELAAPRIPYISNLTGTWIDAQVLTSPEYWLEQMCQTVRFADGIGELLKEKERVLIEVGAGQSLGSFVKQHPDYDSESSRRWSRYCARSSMSRVTRSTCRRRWPSCGWRASSRTGPRSTRPNSA